MYHYSQACEICISLDHNGTHKLCANHFLRVGNKNIATVQNFDIILIKFNLVEICTSGSCADR